MSDSVYTRPGLDQNPGRGSLMRWRFLRRAELVPELVLEEVPDDHPAAGIACRHLIDTHVFRVGNERVLRGWLPRDEPEHRRRLDSAVSGLDVSRFYERVDGSTRVTMTYPRAPRIPRGWRWNLAGFLLTVVSTLWAGAYLEGAAWDFVFHDPGQIATGWAFSVSLLAILAAHEFGHWIVAQRYGLHVTLPFFIPLPVLSPIGTLGAVIKMKTPMYTRRMLLDVGAAGPLAGIAVAIPVSILGIVRSPVMAVDDVIGIRLGEPLLFKAVLSAFGPAVPPGHDVFLGTVAFAGWLGLFVTALNLLPVGQLDGGHVLYALLGRRQHRVGQLFFASMLVAGLWWPGWIVWAMLVLLVIRVRHPPVLDPDLELDRRRKVVGWLAIAVFAACFTPIPFEIP